MTTDLRAALRDAAGTLNTLARRSESSDRHPLVDPDEFYHAAKQYRAIADAPPTVAELLPMVDWRARAIAAEIRAEEAEAHGAGSDALIDAICQRVGARDTGCGGQTVEAGEMRRRMNMTQRIDMLTTAATRWRKVAPLIERLADDVRRRELIARAEFDRRVSDTVTDLLAATQEPTP